MRIREDLIEAVAGGRKHNPTAPSITETRMEVRENLVDYLQDYHLQLRFNWKVSLFPGASGEEIAEAKEAMVRHVLHELYRDVESDLHYVREAIYNRDYSEAQSCLTRAFKTIRGD